jgi:hypothetical protein
MGPRGRPDAVSRDWDQIQVVESKSYPGKNVGTVLYLQCIILPEIRAKWSKFMRLLKTGFVISDNTKNVGMSLNLLAMDFFF